MGGKNSYESIKRYQDKAYDKTLLRFPKGKLDVVKAHAETQGESVNGFINRAIDGQMERDRGGTPSPCHTDAAGAPAGVGVVSLPSPILETAQQAAERAIAETMERDNERSAINE